MTKTDMNMLSRVWSRLMDGDVLRLQDFVEELRHQGGHDIIHVTDEQLHALVTGLEPEDWSNIGFAFGEMLACYSVRDEFTPNEIIGWIISTWTMAQAIRRQANNHDDDLYSVLRGCLATRMYLWEDETAYVLQRFLEISGLSSAGTA